MPDGVVDEDALILPVDESDEKVAENKEGVGDDTRAEVARQLMAGAEMLTDVARHFDVAL